MTKAERYRKMAERPFRGRNARATSLYWLLRAEIEEDRVADNLADLNRVVVNKPVRFTEQPPTADVVAEEDEKGDGWYDSIAPVSTGHIVNPDFVERRTSWNTKLADGLRKWAHWLEERF